MNVLFVYSQDQTYSKQRPLEFPEYIQLGISYISAVLTQHGHRTRLVVISPHYKKHGLKLLEQRICEFTPRLICYTAVSTQYIFIAELAGSIAERHPGIYQLIGGPHASLNPEDVIAGPFDALCVGEGEFPTLELVACLETGADPGGIANLWIKGERGVEKNFTRPFLKNINDLPHPDREMWMDWIRPFPKLRFSVLLGRGCPFECTYCSNHALKRLAEGPYVRFRSPDRILIEVQDLAERYPAVEEMYLEIETIGLNREWILELCAKLQEFNDSRPSPIAFGTNIRVTPNCDFEESFAAMAMANFKFINIGLESGSERVRREILQRNYSNEDVLRTVAQAKANGLRVQIYNLIGIPGEAIADFNMTVWVNRACCPDGHQTSIFYPYPGTRLYSLCKSRGLLDGRFRKNDIERCNAVLDLPEFPRSEIERRYIWFDYSVFRGIIPLYRIFPRVVRAKMRGYPRLMSLIRRMIRNGAVMSFGKFIGDKCRRTA